MRPLMICLHAAKSNAEIIDHLLHDMSFEIRHVVDTYLLEMIREQSCFNKQKDYAFHKIMELVEQQPSFILITCTNYIVLLDQIELETSIPILKIDELLFEQLKEVQAPIKILFTNKQTIEGTMARLKQAIPSELDIEVIFISKVFDWYLADDKLRHDQKVLSTLLDLDASQNIIVVAQLSMANSADKYSKLSGYLVLSPVTAIRNAKNFIGNKET